MSKVICKDLDGKEYEVSKSDLKFRPAVYGVIIRNGKVLLAKQWDGYFFPGGGVELGETLGESLKREIKEESGLEIIVKNLVDCKESFFKLPDQKGSVHSILMFYLCELAGGDLSLDFLDESEIGIHAMPEWVDLKSAGTIKFKSTIDCVEILNKAKSME